MSAQVVSLLGGDPGAVPDEVTAGMVSKRSKADRIEFLKSLGVPDLEPGVAMMKAKPTVQRVNEHVVRVDGKLTFVTPGEQKIVNTPHKVARSCHDLWLGVRGPSFAAVLAAFMCLASIPAMGTLGASGGELEISEVFAIRFSALVSEEDAKVDASEHVRAALDARLNIDYMGWFFRALTPISESTADLLKQTGAKRPDLSFIAYMMTREGFTYSSSRGLVEYDYVECKIFDCYKSYLSLFSPDGDLVWRRRVPFIDLPVFPFEIDGMLVYLGGDSDRTMLYCVDLSTGKASRGFSPVEDVSLEGSEPELFFPYYFSGLVIAAEDFVLKSEGELLNDPMVFAIEFGAIP